MQIETLTTQTHTTLKLSGRLDVTWAEHVLSSALELLRGGKHVLLIDASELEYLSSAGIRVLIRIRREVTALQGSFGIIHPSDFVETTLRTSGLAMLLEPVDTPAIPETSSPEATEPSPPEPADIPGIQIDVHALSTDASLYVKLPAAWQPWQPVQDQDIINIQLPSNVFALGIGAPGVDAADSRSRFGEFASIAGCLSWLPADGGDTPDYLIQAGQFTPSVFAIQALVAEGDFSHLLRFRPTDKTGILPLSDLITQALKTTEAETIALVCIAEIEGLVGAALSRSPGLMTAEDAPGDFPQIRDWMAFCGQRMHSRHSALLVTFAARNPSPALAPYLTSLPSQPDIFAHSHAVVLPFRPLPEGLLDLEEHVRMFYENMEPEDVLHLIEDNREAIGLGQSAFLRGACWCAPITLQKEGSA